MRYCTDFSFEKSRRGTALQSPSPAYLYYVAHSSPKPHRPMKNFLRILAVITLTACTAPGDDIPEPTGQRLQEIVRREYAPESVYIGGTTSWNKRSGGSGILMDREFSYVTPENEFKHQAIHPEPGKWRWIAADAWVRHCKRNKQVIRMHGPIGPQCSTWAKEDDRTADELEESLEDFMKALCRRYKRDSHIKWMDVVNETVQPDGQWFGPKPGTEEWENPWTQIGFDEDHPLRPPLYIKQAFEIANRYAPKTLQIINQHGDMKKPMWEKVKATVLYLREQDLRVDGIGWQAHIKVGWEHQGDNINLLEQLITWAHQNDLEFHITEMNVFLKPDAPDYEAQAQTFSAVLRTLLAKKDYGVVTWSTWNLSDADQYEPDREKRGGIFFENMSPKPAYYAIQQALTECAPR